MTGWLTGDEKEDGCGASVDRLMMLARCYLDAFAGAKRVVVVVHLERKFAIEHIEELAGVVVMVAGFAGAGWHPLFDDAELWRAEEVPAVALAAPGIVIGRFDADLSHLV